LAFLRIKLSRINPALWIMPLRVHIRLFPENDNERIAFEIYTQSQASDKEPIMHSQGVAAFRSASKIPIMDVKELQAQCNKGTLGPDQCYEAFKKMGINYGPGHQGIEKVYVGSDQLLAKLSLPLSVYDTRNQFILHPGLMDSVLQASIGFMIGSGDINNIASLRPVLPFALKEIEIFDSCTSSMWALIQYSDGSNSGDKAQKLDIDLCDETGMICVRLKEFSSRIQEDEVNRVDSSKNIGSLMLQPSWEKQIIAKELNGIDYSQHVVMFCEMDKISSQNTKNIENRINGGQIFFLQSNKKDIAKRFQAYTVQIFEEIQSILKDKSKAKVLLQIVIPMQKEGLLNPQLCSEMPKAP